jgi:hypothetical protein
VKAQVARACDTINYTGVRRMRDTVVLDDIRCSGSAHGECQAQCLIYWKEAWLRSASTEVATNEDRDEAFEQLERLASANVRGADSASDQPSYRCQATELLRASDAIPRWSARSFLHELTSGNVGLWRFVTVMTRIIVEATGRRLGVARRTIVPFEPNELSGNKTPAPSSQGFRPGQLVQIRPRGEIARTLSVSGKNRGLWFDREMVSYCGRTARVKTKVQRIIDERNGQMIEFATDAYILDDVVCRSDRSDGRWFCPRAIYPYWRECWLDPVEAKGNESSSETAGASA